ncbi:MAG: putative ABC transporter permease, partial [Eggerthellaceae bacterium]
MPIPSKKTSGTATSPAPSRSGGTGRVLLRVQRAGTLDGDRHCSFMNVFGIVDADSLVWDDPMYPFLVYGVGVVVCALVLMPLKTALVARRATLVSAGIQFFAATVVVCMLMELAMGFMLNQPNAAGEYPLWDNSQLPFNILGQAWLVNDLALAAVAMLYTWIVYPLCQKALGKLPLRAMNLLAAVV